ncbi:hypothetical protein DL770_000072 [Monosporascus sp. CRB-9-2]|nr:hypothetical protein DL770_000072 [Monosporascus sp. CRB-9-2]
MGYVSDGHRLNRRDDEHLHPRAPIYRTKHPRHGHMDIAAREHVNGTRFTSSYANHGLGKRQSFQHERLSEHLFESRLDSRARAADPADPAFNPAGAYQQIEDSIKYFGAGSLREGQVLSDQTYDDTNRARFGFASMSIFENNDAGSTLQYFQPSGMPLLTSNC